MSFNWFVCCVADTRGTRLRSSTLPALPDSLRYKRLHRARENVHNESSKWGNQNTLYVLLLLLPISHYKCINSTVKLNPCLRATTGPFCLSEAPVSTSILPPVWFSVCLSIPRCCHPVCLRILTFIQILLISAFIILPREISIFRPRLPSPRPHGKRLYVADRARGELEGSQPCSM